MKGGGALTAAGDILFAFKGNNTLEYYKYTPAVADPLPLTADRQNSQGSFKPQAASFKLDVFPNPFSRTTTVSYSLPRAGPVSLNLYDVSGKLVRTLAEGQRNAGSYSIGVGRRWSAVTLSSGVYLLKLETHNSGLETGVLTQKLIIE